MRRWGPPWAGGKALGAERRAAGESVGSRGRANVPLRGPPSGRGQRDSVLLRNVGGDAVFGDRGRANDAVFLLFACVLFACVYMGQRNSCEQHRRKRQPNGEGATGRLRGEAHEQPARPLGGSELVQGGDGPRRGHRLSQYPTLNTSYRGRHRLVNRVKRAMSPKEQRSAAPRLPDQRLQLRHPRFGRLRLLFAVDQFVARRQELCPPPDCTSAGRADKRSASGMVRVR